MSLLYFPVLHEERVFLLVPVVTTDAPPISGPQ